MLIDIQNIIKNDLNNIEYLWIVLKKETAGSTPAVSYISIPKNTLTYELDDNSILENTSIQLKVWFIINGINKINFFNLKENSSKKNLNVISYKTSKLFQNNDESRLKCLEEINQKIIESGKIKSYPIGNKNLIYYSIYFDNGYIDLLEYSVNSIFTKSKINFDILLITDEATKELIIKKSVFKKTNIFFHITETPENGIEASQNKCRIFEYEKINDYKNILYLDCDVICTKDFSQIFNDAKIEFNVLYTQEGIYKNTYSLFKTPTHGFSILNDDYLNEMIEYKQHPFNAGQFLFKNCDRMRQHFENVKWFMCNWSGEYFFEQSFMNYYFCKAKITNQQYLNDYIKVVSLNKELSNYKNYPLLHLAAPALDSKNKINRIKYFYKKIKFNWIAKYKQKINTLLYDLKKSKIDEKTISESGGKWIISENSKKLDFSKTKIYGDTLLDLYPWIPDTGILELKNGILDSNHLPTILVKGKSYSILELTLFGSYRTRSKLDPEVSWALDRYKKHFYKPLIKENIEYKEGKGVLLYSTWANSNYCHFLLDTMSKLDILNSLNLKLNDYDWVIIPEHEYFITKELITNLKISNDKIIYLSDKNRKNYQFDTLHIPSLNGRNQVYSENAFKEIRRLFKIENENLNSNRRIYLPRKVGDRSFSNWYEVEDLLKKYNFEFIKTDTEKDIINIMRESKIVISPHGAGLANCVFCPAGTTVIELMPKFWQKLYYISLSNSIGLKHHCMICEDESLDPLPDKVMWNDGKSRSIYVDIEKLEELIINEI